MAGDRFPFELLYSQTHTQHRDCLLDGLYLGANRYHVLDIGCIDHFQ